MVSFRIRINKDFCWDFDPWQEIAIDVSLLINCFVYEGVSDAVLIIIVWRVIFICFCSDLVQTRVLSLHKTISDFFARGNFAQTFSKFEEKQYFLIVVLFDVRFPANPQQGIYLKL